MRHGVTEEIKRNIINSETLIKYLKNSYTHDGQSRVLSRRIYSSCRHMGSGSVQEIYNLLELFINNLLD